MPPKALTPTLDQRAYYGVPGRTSGNICRNLGVLSHSNARGNNKNNTPLVIFSIQELARSSARPHRSMHLTLPCHSSLRPWTAHPNERKNSARAYLLGAWYSFTWLVPVLSCIVWRFVATELLFVSSKRPATFQCVLTWIVSWNLWNHV